MAQEFLLIQHTDTTTPGNVLSWFQKNNLKFKHIFLHRGQSLPEPDQNHKIILCGGGLHVDQEHLYPWLVAEKKFLEASIKLGCPIVGLCLGGQLCAQVLGARVAPHERGWEVGWWDVNLQATEGLVGFENNQTLKVSQYHRYIFDAPQASKIVASNDWWQTQAFLWNNQVLGFQFHPERDLVSNEKLAREKDLPREGRTQECEEILNLGQRYQRQTEQWFLKVLAGFFNLKND